MKKDFLAIVLQTAGATAVSTGVFMLFPPVGVVTAGIFLLLFGLAVERRNAQ
jgi:hypothetical protein